MKPWNILSLLIFVLPIPLHAESGYQQLYSTLDSIAHLDILPPGIDHVTYLEICTPIIRDEFNGSTNLFMMHVQSCCTNLCKGADLSSRTQLSRAKGCLEILREDNSVLSRQTFLYCMTNCDNIVVRDIATYNFVEAAGASDELRVCYLGDEIQSMPVNQISEITESLLLAFDERGGGPTETNRMIKLMLDIANEKRHSWNAADQMISKWWPAYATSSNRYMSAISARNTVPPPASTNYINRVITELEALPPGTMQMLSTNHLGAAWNED